jgi:hypothetical protein
MEKRAERMKKAAEEWKIYSAEKKAREAAEEDERERKRILENWYRLDGRQWPSPTARAIPGSSDAIAGQSKRRTRRDIIDPLEPTEISLGEPLEGNSSLGEEDKSGSNIVGGRGDAGSDDSESVKTGLDLVLGAGNWGTASPIGRSSNKRRRSNGASQ